MYDLIIKQATLLSGEKIAIGIRNGVIEEVAPTIETSARQELILEENQYLSAGWIDDHVHCFEKMDLYYDYPDQIGVEKGVTTVIDAGTTGAENIRDFYSLAKEAKTNVYALVNISKWGIVKQDELADLSKVQAALVSEVLQDLPDFIVGIKARMSKTVIGENGMKPLHLAKQIQKENQHIPLMVHIGSAPPKLSEILEVMESGDILTHCFNGKDNGFLTESGDQLKEIAQKAKDKGIIFDIGHGTDSFNFHVAETAKKEGVIADSISTDIYIRNRMNGPVYNMATTMEKLHVVGYEWADILKKVTENPAKQFHLKNKGQIKKGYDADFTIFTFTQEENQLVDSNGVTRISQEQIHPVKTIVGGEIYVNQL